MAYADAESRAGTGGTGVTDDALKYVIVETMGGELPIIFNNILDHAAVVPNNSTPISAGYCEIWPVEGVAPPADGNYLELEVRCFGQSTTLKLKSRPEDAEIIERELARYRN